MNEEQADRWKSEVLDVVFAGLATSASLRHALAYKGARVLALRLGRPHRRSLDLDATLLPAVLKERGSTAEVRAWLEREFATCLARAFERQDPVRFTLEGVRVTVKPPHGHPRGWNAFAVRLQVRDAFAPGVLGLPAVEIDVAAPETLDAAAFDEMTLDGGTVRACTLARIAGEKLRAFLTSLPAYSRNEFQAAGHLPKDVPWAEAWGAVQTVVAFFEQEGVFPLRWEVPDVER